MRFHFLWLVLATTCVVGQKQEVPNSYANIEYDKEGKLYFEKDGKRYYEAELEPRWTIDQLLGNPKGTEKGITLNFGDLQGRVTYGLIPYGQAPHPMPVFRFTEKLENGSMEINIKKDFRYPYDFVNWKGNKKLTIGYRVETLQGSVLFDGEVAVVYQDSTFQPVPTVYEGPFVSHLTDTSVVISFETSLPAISNVKVGDRMKGLVAEKRHHEYFFKDLKPDSKYEYTVKCKGFEQSYHFTTAPREGSRQQFVFAYASDSRHAKGGGERRIYGANAYIMKKLAAVAYQNDAAFVQFSGDMIDGYLGNKEELHLQYTNWKKAIEPFWHYMPWFISMGNHEALGHVFKDEDRTTHAFVDKFPFDSLSAEATFAEAFVNPENGPVSEDRADYDPKRKTMDFPSYKENVFYYTYDNVAMIVLNSNYWFAPSLKRGETSTGGGLHAYIMDMQMQWLKETLEKLEADDRIDHIFVTQHTPAFPNGGHSKDDMWYHGNNEKRPYVKGKPVKKGIIERRDEYLDLLVNTSSKVVGILTGDEHNFNWMKITDEVPMHPEGYEHDKVQIKKPIYQINNGAAGAPYYAQEDLIWSDHVNDFSVENAICLFYVDGDSIVMKVINPDTLNEITEVKLK